jgi:hypothetical protein
MIMIMGHAESTAGAFELAGMFIAVNQLYKLA